MRKKSAEERMLDAIFGTDTDTPEPEQIIASAGSLAPTVRGIIERLDAIKDPDVDAWDRQFVLDKLYDIVGSSKECNNFMASRRYQELTGFINKHETLMPPSKDEPSLLDLLAGVTELFDKSSGICEKG